MDRGRRLTTQQRRRDIYRLLSSNQFHNGRTFNSLAAAKQTADRLAISDPDTPYDVAALVDRESLRVVYTPAVCRAGQAIRGSYMK